MTECNEPPHDYVTRKETPSWVEKGFWDSDVAQGKQIAEISDTERKIKGQQRQQFLKKFDIYFKVGGLTRPPISKNMQFSGEPKDNM